MNKWKQTLQLSDVWQSGDVPESEVHNVGKIIAKRMRKLYPDYADYDKYGYEFEEMIDRFDSIITLDEYQKDPEDYNFFGPDDEFNDVMECLYDWADANKLWIDTRG